MLPPSLGGVTGWGGAGIRPPAGPMLVTTAESALQWLLASFLALCRLLWLLLGTEACCLSGEEAL